MLMGRSQTHVDGVPRKLRTWGDYSIVFSLGVFWLSFVAIGTDAVEDLLRSSVFPCFYACVGGKRVPQGYAPI